jgi:Ca2+ transporting ATPase
VTVQKDEDLAWLEGTVILCTVAGVLNLQAVQDYMKERSFRKLSEAVSFVQIPVIRGGQPIEIPRYDLVVGDIVTIGVGDILEADGVMMRGEGVECDESALTGEPEDLKKNPDDAPFIFSGTSVKNGSGQCLITAVGINSMAGKITALIRGQKVAADEPAAVKTEAVGESQTTPADEPDKEQGDEDESDGSVLRAKLDLLAGRIAYMAFCAAGICSVVMLVYFLIDNYGVLKRKFDSKKDIDKMLKAVVTGIAIVVVAVPEGLPLAVTLSLSLSVKKMEKDQNLVKHLDATETMGSATTICSDKTGTLTQNRMTVIRIYTGGEEFCGELANDRTCGRLLKAQGGLPSDLERKITDGISLTKAEGTYIKWGKDADRWDQFGNKTDCALLALTLIWAQTTIRYAKDPSI